MIIGVDLDSVLANLSKAASERINVDFPSANLTPEKWTSWNFQFAKHVGLKPSDMSNYMDLAWERWENMELQEPNIRLSLLMLRGLGHTVHVITSRNAGTHVPVQKWLEYNMIFYDGLTFVPKGIDKFEFPIDILIDDAPKFVESAQFHHRDKRLYLRDQPWNQDVEITLNNVERVPTLAKAVERIKLIG